MNTAAAQSLFAAQALLPGGWASDVRVEIDAAGKVASVTPGAQAAPGDHRAGLLLPAPGNLHSHAFQRAMAGLTEARGPDPRDSFWTWRQLMFRFLDRLTPDHVQAITALVQMEMLEAGYASVGEFHYLHHQPGGVPYADRAEMAGRVCAAASRTGIGLTLLPVLYSQGGCDGRPLGDGQIRFGNDLDGFGELLEGSRAHLGRLPGDSVLGLAPHSLRAVTPEALAELPGRAGPIHMHLAEQVPEVDEVQAAYGARPVEWALDHLPLGPDWCLIHCTQMTPAETEGLARSGAVAGLCPITEASLGDGIFDGTGWFAANGAMGVGSDSNIRISLTEELRQLEYSQRLRDRGRAVLATREKSTGRRLFEAAAAGAGQALGRGSGRIAAGDWADLLALDGDATDLIGRQGDRALDSWIFTAGDALTRDVWAAGRHVVREGRHVARDEITAGYRAVMRDLEDAL